MNLRFLAVFCGILSASAAQADPLDALKDKGWTVTDQGPSLRMEWRGVDAADIAQALLEPPQLSSVSPKETIRQRQAGFGTLGDCTASADSNNRMATSVCQAALPRIVGWIVMKPEPSTVRVLTLTASPTPAGRERLAADLPSFLALIQAR